MNKTGITCLDTQVLVKLDALNEKSTGGIIFIENEQEKAARVYGTIIDVGLLAFRGYSEESLEIIGDNMPKKGDRVIVERYAGFNVYGKDAEEYRLMTDANIVAKIDFTKQELDIAKERKRKDEH